MPSDLLPKQFLFTLNVAKLINHAIEIGFDVTLGEAWRSPETAEIYAKQGKGIVNSLHRDRLAIDLNLFRDGVYLDDGEAHRVLADYWKSLHPDNRWGGDFQKQDGNHFSMAYMGRA